MTARMSAFHEKKKNATIAMICSATKNAVTPQITGRLNVLSFSKMLMFLLTEEGSTYIQKLSRAGGALCNTCVILPQRKTVRLDRAKKVLKVGNVLRAHFLGMEIDAKGNRIFAIRQFL